MVLSYALSLVQVYVIALIVDALAPTFKGEKNQIQALKLAAYAFTAAWVAGVAQIVPWIGGLLALAGGIYSIYLFYLGLPTLMKCPPDQAVPIRPSCIIVCDRIGAVIGFAVGSITGGANPGRCSQFRYRVQQGQSDRQARRPGPRKWKRRPSRSKRRSNPAMPRRRARQSARCSGPRLRRDKVEALAPDRLKPFVPDTLRHFRERNWRSNAMVRWVCRCRKRTRPTAATSARCNSKSPIPAPRKVSIALAGWASVEEDKETDNGYSKTYHDDDRIIHEQWDNSGRVNTRSLSASVSP